MSLPRLTLRARSIESAPDPWQQCARSCRTLRACLLATILVGLASSASAQAGTYTIGDCPDSFTRSGVAGPWRFFGPAGTDNEASCENEAAALWFAMPELPTSPVGFAATTEGSRLTIVNARLWWRAFGGPGDSTEATMEATDAAGEDLAISSWNGGGILVDEESSPEELSFSKEDEAANISVSEHCELAGQCPLAFEESFTVGIQFFGAELTLLDEVPPTVAITGIERESGAAVSGPIQAKFTAADPNAGVENAELLLDGSPIVTRSYSSSCSFTQLLACPATATDTLEFAGTSVAEGTHQLAVRVTNAAGDTSITPAQTIVTSHTPHVPNGTPCPTPAFTLSVDHRTGQVTVPLGKGADIDGRLACGSAPVAAASIGLAISQTAGSAAPRTIALQTTTTGSFHYHVPPGPSRKLTFSYVAYSNQAAPSAQSSVRINVRPRLRLLINPRRTHNGGTITWCATVRGGPYPKRAMPLNLQVKVGRRWKTFEQPVVSQGTLEYRYTFERTRQPTTYTFRVALPAGGDVGYPYASAASNAVNVHVAPGHPARFAESRERPLSSSSSSCSVIDR
jgi:hypothetical protein